MAARRMLLLHYHDGHVGAWPLWLVVLACVLVAVAVFALCLCYCSCKDHARGGSGSGGGRSSSSCCVSFGGDDCGDCDCGDCDCDGSGECVGCCCEICVACF